MAHSYDDMIPKLNLGVEYHGFRYATLAETSALFDHAGLGLPVVAHNWHESPRTGVFGQLIELLDGLDLETGRRRKRFRLVS